MAFLYEKIDALREYGSSAVLPSYIPENLNPNFELRRIRSRRLKTL